MDERWLPVVGLAGRYEVSDQGRVRRSVPGPGTRVGYVLRPRATRKGYVQVSLDARDYKIHILVLTAFEGPPPSPEHQVNHRDGKKTNNALKNLEWVTQSENMRHAIATGLVVQARGERHPNSRLTDAQRREICALRGALSQRQIAEQFGVSKSLVNVLHRSWADIEMTLGGRG